MVEQLGLDSLLQCNFTFSALSYLLGFLCKSDNTFVLRNSHTTHTHTHTHLQLEEDPEEKSALSQIPIIRKNIKSETFLQNFTSGLLFFTFSLTPFTPPQFFFLSFSLFLVGCGSVVFCCGSSLLFAVSGEFFWSTLIWLT